MEMYRKTCAWLVCLLILILALPETIFANEYIDGDEPGSITIYYEHKGEKISNAEFDLYRVADINAEGEILPIEPFAKFNIGAYGRDDASLKTLSEELNTYIQRNHISPFDSGCTNAEGLLSFPQKNQVMKPGVYFIIGHKVTNGEIYIETLPFLISLPKQSETGEWIYHVMAKPKADSRTEPGGETPSTPGTPSNTPSNTPTELPYTGQLWWPIPIMFVLGMALVLAGMMLRKEE